jgi:DNA polymerase-3 subunit delta'
MGLSSVIGHKQPIQFLLRSAHQDRLSHAYLFSGPKGIGKFTVACEFARYLVCRAPTDQGDWCGECESCRKANPEREFGCDLHPDILIFEPAVRGSKQRVRAESRGERLEKQQTPIESIREIARTAHFPPVYGTRRIFIVPQAETMSPPAANALLKTLEEPPPAAMIILVAPSEGQLLPTIVSRCHVVAFRPVSTDEMAAALADLTGIDQTQARALARLFEGRPGRAIQAIGDPEFVETRAAFGTIMERLTNDDGANPLEISDAVCFQLRGAIAKKLAGKEDEGAPSGAGYFRGRADARMATAFAEFAASWYRDLMITRLGDEDGIVNRDLAAPIRAGAHRLSAVQSGRGLAIAMRAKRLIDANINPQLVLDSMLLRCSKL